MISILASTTLASSAKPLPHLISILQDDLGYYDSGVHSEKASLFTHNISALAKEGIVLTNHYTHWHCSPTRRSFLSGRLPIHHGEQLSADDSDDIDLRTTWISGKLASAGYEGHWFGKWHTGFRSMAHLGASNGFKTTVGSFQTGGAYSGPKHSMRWQNDHPIWDDAQFADKPKGCGTTQLNGASAAACDPTQWRNNTMLQCGDGYKFPTGPSNPGECCALCQADTKCTHWVFAGGKNGNKGDCHLKSGESCPGDFHKGYTSGIVRGPTPGPSPGPSPPPAPLGPAQCANEYSTDLWGSSALQAVQEHDTTDATKPLYLHLCFQAVHTPYDAPAHQPKDLTTYQAMLWDADIWIGAIIAELKAKNMWDNTFLMYSADNGGVEDGINWPLRGEKHSNWEGGMRTAAFVSGGLIPAQLRGTTNGVNMHIVDWYATFSTLAGVDPTDSPKVAPLSVDLKNTTKNIYGDDSFPPLDGVDVMPYLLAGAGKSAFDAAHKYLVISKEVVIAGKWKLLVSQPSFKSQNNGWKGKDGKWRTPNKTESHDCMAQNHAPGGAAHVLPVPKAGGHACLYDLRADPGEHVDVSQANKDVVAELTNQLNLIILTQRDCNGWTYKSADSSYDIPGPLQPDGTRSCSPSALLGYCDQGCANALWASYGKADGPICGVPNCTNASAL